MVVYRLACEGGHEFEGWFASGEAFERQRETRVLPLPAIPEQMH